MDYLCRNCGGTGLDMFRQPCPCSLSGTIVMTVDICPHGGSSSFCEWCGYKSQISRLLKRIEALEADRKRLREALEEIVEDIAEKSMKARI